MRYGKGSVFGLVVMASWLCAMSLSAAEAEPSPLPAWSRAPSVGFNLNEVASDFGCGLTLTSPFVRNGRLAARASVNMAWHPGVNTWREGWFPYSSYRLGLVAVGGRVGGFVRLYGEGGGLYLRTNAHLSDHDHWGAYGHFGFEFLLTQTKRPKMSYFAELGAVGIGARAEKLSSQPLYSNGFSISTGLRVYLK